MNIKRWWKEKKFQKIPIDAVQLNLQGWNEERSEDNSRTWFDSQRCILELSIVNLTEGAPPLSDEAAIQDWCRCVAGGRGAGLIEVKRLAGALGEGIGLIYKRLQHPAYMFTAQWLIPRGANSILFTIVDQERGTTGIREATITAEMLESGELSIEEYKSRWAQDPYQPSYHGVDRSVLRFISDDECYDNRFPDHPLTRVRRALYALRYAATIEQRI